MVTGGAGYIGSHCSKTLRKAGWEVVVYDNLTAGHRESVKDVELVVGDLGEKDRLDEVFSKGRFDAVMHFASLTYVGESVKDPVKYYRNNVSEGLSLLSAMIDHGVKNFIFSSTAAVYGEPAIQPIPEDHALLPVNPYGASKFMFERIATDLSVSHGLRPVFLRYFNAAGADPDGGLGEDHDPETHLIPLVIDAALGRRGSLDLFGDDYPTFDGTCIRDYIHVTDLAEAHLKALDYLSDGDNKTPEAFNLGAGSGFSVRQVIETVEKVVGKNVPFSIAPRREGDPPELVALSGKAKSVLGWKPTLSSLEDIVETAFRWREKHPDGYQKK